MVTINKDIISNLDKVKTLKNFTHDKIIKSIVNEVGYSHDFIDIDSDNFNKSTLKRLFGNKFKDSEYNKFFEDYSIVNNNNSILSKDLKVILSQMNTYSSRLIEAYEYHKFKTLSKIDISNNYWDFKISYKNSEKRMKISEFLKLLDNKINVAEISSFTTKLNAKIKELKKEDKTILLPSNNKIDYMDVRDTFISLVTETYPFGTEEDLFKNKKLRVEDKSNIITNTDLKVDRFGNYYKIIGKSDVMFACHLDTASLKKESINLYSVIEDGQEFIETDKTTILGADDKAGVAIMLYMMSNNVPGVYYFFLGEERGGIGSSKVSRNFLDFDFLSKINKVISFDRRGTKSLITKQYGEESCSSEFAVELCSKFREIGIDLEPDDTGVFTDSANFIGLIPECTNISVGYYNEHTNKERQNMTFLLKLAKACISIDWNSLGSYKEVQLSTNDISNYSELVKELNMSSINNYLSFKFINNKFVILLRFVKSSVDSALEDLNRLKYLLGEDLEIEYDSDKIKIFL